MGGGFSRPYERLLMLVEKPVVSLKSSWGRAVLTARMRDPSTLISKHSYNWSEAKHSRLQEETGRF